MKDKKKRMNTREYLALMDKVYNYWLEMVFRLRCPRNSPGDEFNQKVIEEIISVKKICETALLKPNPTALQAAHDAYCSCQYIRHSFAPFETGQIYVTPGARDLGVDLRAYLDRHERCDWGDIHEEGKAANKEALQRHDSLVSVYKTPKGELWIVTEADRSATILALANEY